MNSDENFKYMKEKEEKVSEEKIFEEEISEEKIEEIKELEKEVIVNEKKPKKSKKKIKHGEKYTVLNITSQKIILKDKDGNGLEKPLPDEINFKIGDKIEL